MLRVNSRWWLAAPALLGLPLIAGSWVFYRAASAHAESVRETASANRVAFTLTSLDIRTATRGEPVGSADRFRDAALFRGRLYLCAPGGIYAYDPDGTIRETWHTGRELPPGEPVALAAGTGSNGTELYIATQGAGLLVFNGSTFRQILPLEPRLRNFTAALALNTGRILLGTANDGVLVWDGSKVAELAPQLSHAHITSLAGSDADIWIGTIDSGAYRLHAGQLDRLAGDLPDPHVLSLAVSGNLAYAGTPVGVVEFREGRRNRVLAEGYFARSLDVDEDAITVGTEDEGIISLPLAPGRRFGIETTPQKFSVPVERIFRIDGAHYALAGGLYRAEASGSPGPQHRWTQALAPEKGRLTDRNIAALSVAPDGRVWVGYFDRGLDVADAGFENVLHLEDDRLFCVNRIAQGLDRTAIATANGLVLFDASLKIRQVLDRKAGLLADHVTDVLFRPGGMVIATPAGLSFADADGIRSLYVFHGLVNNHVYALGAAGDRIAAGTLGGLSLLENDAVQVNYTTANSGLKHNWISALARVGDEWFAGTYGAGVMRLDSGGEWHGFSDLKSGFEVNPNAMTLAEGRLYVGTLGHGLWIYDTTSGRWSNTTAGLPSANVTAIAAGNGYVYVGTENGLVRFRPGELR